MGYGKRIDTICSLLSSAATFADVGCDHGYCSEYMLKNGLCEKAILSDVSRGSLEKAKELLADFIADGSAAAVLGDGFFGVPESTEEVLIAGMGGMEIVEIMSHPKYGFIPQKFVLQPMHDSDRLRKFLVENGGIIERDDTFEDGRFYDIIIGHRRKEGEERQTYTPLEYEFGRDNLKDRGAAFIARTEKQLKNVNKYLKNARVGGDSRAELLARKARLESVLKMR